MSKVREMLSSYGNRGHHRMCNRLTLGSQDFASGEQSSFALGRFGCGAGVGPGYTITPWVRRVSSGGRIPPDALGLTK